MSPYRSRLVANQGVFNFDVAQCLSYVLQLLLSTEEMFMEKAKDVFLSIRVTSPIKAAFMRKARRYGEPSTVLRELVEAFLENRLTIKRPVNGKEELYESGK